MDTEAKDDDLRFSLVYFKNLFMSVQTVSELFWSIFAMRYV